MSQNIWTSINPATTSGTQLATLLNDFKDAVVSGLSGATRPSTLQAGGGWIDTSVADTYIYKIYDGTSDTEIYRVNLLTGAATIGNVDTSFQITKTSDDVVAPIFALAKSRIAGGGQVLSGDGIVEIQAKSKTDTGSIVTVGRVRMVAGQNHTTAAQGAYWVIEAISNGSTTLSEIVAIRNGLVGIGITSPENTLHVRGSTGIKSEQRADDANGAKIVGRKQRIAGSGQVLSGDVLLQQDFNSTDNAGAELTGAQIEASATEDHTSTAHGTKFSFKTKNNGSTSLTEKMAIGEKVEISAVAKIAAPEFDKEDVASTATITALSTNNGIVKITGATATDIQGLDATGKAKAVVIHNASSAVVTVSHEDAGATASNRITLPGAVDVEIPVNSSIELFYDTGASRWKQKSGSGTGSGSGGSGGGVINLITNGDADNSTVSIFTAYADAAGTRPVDGTGGSPNVTTSITSTSPLRGTKSYLLTKDAANRQGQGWAVGFSVPLSYRAKSLKIAMDYIVNSGTFVAGTPTTDGDLIVYLYDVTNSVLIEPSNIKLFSNSTTLSETFEATFQTSATGADYRLIIHAASTSASAYELKVDDVTVSPQTYVYGAAVTQLPDLTMTATNFGNGTVGAVRASRAGEYLRMGGRMTLGSTLPTGNIILNMPSGYTINTARSVGQVVGRVVATNGGGINAYLGTVEVNSSTSFLFKGPRNDSVWNATIPYTFVAGHLIDFEIEVSIVGWENANTLSNGADTRVVAMTTSVPAQARTGTLSTLTLNAPGTGADTHGALSGNTYTIPVTGWYETGIKLIHDAAAGTAGQRVVARVDVTSTSSAVDRVLADTAVQTTTSFNISLNGSAIQHYNQGDTVTWQSSHAGSVAIANAVTENYVWIERVAGPQAIAESEKISCSYRNSAGQNLPNNTPTTLLLATKVEDTHNIYNTGTGLFTFQQAGLYGFMVQLITNNAGGWASSEQLEISLQNQDGSATYSFTKFEQTATHALEVGWFAVGSSHFLAGNQMRIQVSQNSGADLTLTANQAGCTFTVWRIK